MKAIVAMSKNGSIGNNDGTLPWPKDTEDIQYFRTYTMGKNCIVGRKTYDTLPHLKGRTLSLLTTNVAYNDIIIPAKSVALPAQLNGNRGTVVGSVFGRNDYYARCFYSLDEFLDNTPNRSECCVIGGASIYELFLNYITEFSVTTFNDEYDADVKLSIDFSIFPNKNTVFEDEKKTIILYNRDAV